MLVHIRSGGKWKEWRIQAPKLYKTPNLRGFEFDVAAVFAAAESVNS